MIPKHSNPKSEARRARAPYNFVPLPEKVVVAAEPPPQDEYTGYTGWIDAELVTRSPLYIRGMLTEKEYGESGEKGPDELTPEEKLARAPFFQIDKDRPLIPGSSLRGMVRTIVEIAGHGKLHWVAAKPKVSFRAVAQGGDPLSRSYYELLGKGGSNVLAGYLNRRRDGHWEIVPAQHPSKLQWPGERAYLTVRESVALAGKVPGLEAFGASNYAPGHCRVGFEAVQKTGDNGAYVEVTKIGSADENFAHYGTLVWSGDMLETDRNRQHASPREKHALVLDSTPQTLGLPIPKQVVQDYADSLTEFQREHFGTNGCLQQAWPVFFVQYRMKVLAFGHSPNFRIPAWVTNPLRAASPRDFVPTQLRGDDVLDLAEAIFGWVPEPNSVRKSSCAGRVFFEDAHYHSAAKGIWQSVQPVIPQILGSPKPTTFQHYLVQDENMGHDPDVRLALAHYGTPPVETSIRGHKRYWMKGENPRFTAQFGSSQEQEKKEKQLTRIMPVKAGVRFRMRVRFESLRNEELGALLWALTLPGAEGSRFCHSLGMGKPLGMGAVQLENVTLQLTNRPARYGNLFDGEAAAWTTGAGESAGEEDKQESLIKQFECFVLQQLPDTNGAKRLADLERMQNLMAMLTWQGEDPGPSWLEMTRYLEIERPSEGRRGTADEYKEDRVLPTPLDVMQTQLRASAARSTAEKLGELQSGRLDRFFADRGFGYIKPDGGGKEVWVHKDKFPVNVMPHPGQHLRYRLKSGSEGLYADDVTVI